MSGDTAAAKRNKSIFWTSDWAVGEKGRTGQVLCEMYLPYTKFEICEMNVFLRIRNQWEWSRIGGEDAFLALLSSFHL